MSRRHPDPAQLAAQARREAAAQWDFIIGQMREVWAEFLGGLRAHKRIACACLLVYLVLLFGGGR
jgi:hypothetical protein